MAKTASEDAAAVTVNRLTILAAERELDALDDKKTTLMGQIRACRKRLKADGVNLRMLDEMRALKRRDPDEIIEDERVRQQYAAFMNLDLGAQTEFEFEAANPEEETERAKYDAYVDGKNFGKRGDPAEDNPHEGGTVAHVAWENGRQDGLKLKDGEDVKPAKRGRAKKGSAGAEFGEAAGTA